MGAGGVGAYVGGHLARAGEDVTLIDPWPEHIETMKHNGLNLSGTQGEHTVRVNACIFTKCKACTKLSIRSITFEY